jgi:predicted enzyme related to lactoylglutathione lyase
MALSNGARTPYWLSYISSPDVDATVKLADDLGGRILTPPSQIPTVGRFAVLTDPQGAAFAVFTPDGEAPGHEGEANVGEFSWHELATHDYPAAFRFYERLFQWEKMAATELDGGGSYQMFGRNGVMLGGMFNNPPGTSTPLGWLHYVLVADLARALDAVTTHGGQVVSGPMVVPGGDTIAVCVDPQGARFALHARK